jgi:hypothetical protein
MVQRADRAVRQLFVEESVSVQRIVTAIIAAHHNKEKPHKGISGGDPFVIAFGQERRRALDRRRRASRQRRETAKSLSCATPKA